MIYCVSDIHGELERFQQMLELIHFSDQDTLYMLGDAIDRAPLGVDVLELIMYTPNIKMILGNHEQMCFATLGPTSIRGARDMWKNNGGDATYQELVYHSSKEKRFEILKFIAGLPDHMEVKMEDGRKFYLVHGMIGRNTDERIWNRPTTDAASPFPDKKVIVGHTPTCYMTKRRNEPFHIWHGNGIIDIDCGCGNKSEFRRLSCLRLDDMAEFYV